MGGGTYALHNKKDGEKPYISAVSGAVESKDEKIITSDPSLSGKYLELEQYDLSKTAGTYVLAENNRTPTYQFSALGTEKKNLVLDRWGTKRVKEVSHGDIIRGWSTEASKQYLSQGGLPKAFDDKEKEIYYEVTDTGFQRLSFNHYEKGKVDGMIMYGTSDEELDKKARNGDFITLKNPNDSIRILGFKDGNYPNTSKPSGVGEFSSGTIIIEEDLKSGKKIHYEINLLFTIVDGGLSIKHVDDLSFGIQELPSSDVYYAPRDKKNEVIVEDTRHTPKAWDLKATMENPLHYLNGELPQELLGSSILMLDPKGDKVLSKDGVVVHKTSDSEAIKGENKIKWNNQLNEGYRLFIKNGTAENNKRYESTITYSIDEKPKAKAAGSKK